MNEFTLDIIISSISNVIKSGNFNIKNEYDHLQFLVCGLLKTLTPILNIMYNHTLKYMKI